MYMAKCEDGKACSEMECECLKPHMSSSCSSSGPLLLCLLQAPPNPSLVNPLSTSTVNPPSLDHHLPARQQLPCLA